MLIALGQSFQLENEFNIKQGEDKTAFASNFEDFPTNLQSFLRKFNISYFPKFESLHDEDTNRHKSRLPEKDYALESARQIDISDEQRQTPFFTGSLNSYPYNKFKVVLPKYVPNAMRSHSGSSYARNRETMKPMKTPESKLIFQTPKYDSAQYIKRGRFRKNRFPNVGKKEDENFTQRPTNPPSYKKFYIKEKMSNSTQS